MKILLCTILLLFSINAHSLGLFPTKNPHEVAIAVTVKSDNLSLDSLKKFSSYEISGHLLAHELFKNVKNNTNYSLKKGEGMITNYVSYEINERFSLAVSGSVNTDIDLKAGVGGILSFEKVYAWANIEHQGSLSIGAKYYFDSFAVGAIVSDVGANPSFTIAISIVPSKKGLLNIESLVDKLK